MSNPFFNMREENLKERKNIQEKKETYACMTISQPQE